MRLSSYTTPRILAVLLTICVIAAHQYLPRKTLQLHPDPEPSRFSFIFGPDHAGSPSIDWIDREKNHFWCNYAPGDTYSCAWSLNLAPDRVTGIDLSDYDGLNIVIRYKGNAPRIRLFLRDFDSTYSDIAKAEVSSKVMAAAIPTTDLNRPAYVLFGEFSVAEWWITEFNIPREHSAPTLNNTIAIGLDFNVYSQNEVQVDKIDAIGVWIKKETLYFGIISLWMAFILFEVAWRFYLIHKQAKADAQRISRLANDYKVLEQEKEEFEALSTTDVLTGVMNRAGIQQFLDKLFEASFSRGELGVLLFDVDHFKRINDQFGHDVGDLILSGIADIMVQNIRQTDVFGRWGGEEFILICPQINEERLTALAEKLRASIEQHIFETANGALRVTVSVGATKVDAQENFEAVFKRADAALYQAKNSGRNQVQMARCD